MNGAVRGALRAGAVAGALLLAAGSVATFLLPAHRARGVAPALPAAEQSATIAALAPRPGRRPVVAVLALNEGTETTDFLVPFALLTESGAVDVVAVAPREGAVTLMPALTVLAQATTASFDARHPGGADYVVVPAMHVADDPAVLAWVRDQARRGATVVGICEGARILAEAGVLDGREATTHWFFAGRFRAKYPRVRWKGDRRYVVDGAAMTTTGVSASLPASLALVEAMAGRDVAARLAERHGVTSWGAQHDSSLYRVDRAALRTAAANLLAFWNRDAVSLAVHDGTDDVALALTADAWARTLKTSVRSEAAGGREVTLRSGLTLVVDAAQPDAAQPDGARSEPVPDDGDAIAAALAAIAAREGEATADFVALQLEMPR